MDLKRELDKLVQGVTSSSSKKKVIKARVEGVLHKFNKMWYSQLLGKLKEIKSGERNIDDYINDVEEKSKS